MGLFAIPCIAYLFLLGILFSNMVTKNSMHDREEAAMCFVLTVVVGVGAGAAIYIAATQY